MKRPMKYHNACAEVDVRSDGWCEANADVCPPGLHRGVHHHHIRLRSQGGPDEASNLLLVCSAAHRWIHDHPARSYELGLLQRTSA